MRIDHIIQDLQIIIYLIHKKLHHVAFAALVGIQIFVVILCRVADSAFMLYLEGLEICKGIITYFYFILF